MRVPPRLGEIRRGTEGKYFIYEFAGGARLRWAELWKFVAGLARGTRHPDPRNLVRISPAEQTSALRAARAAAAALGPAGRFRLARARRF